MQIQAVNTADPKAPLLVVVYEYNQAFSFNSPESESRVINSLLGFCPNLVKNGETAFTVSDEGRPIVLTGHKSYDLSNRESLRRAIARGLKECRKHKMYDLTIYAEALTTEQAQAIAETCHLALYEYKAYLSDKGSQSFMRTVNIHLPEASSDVQRAIEMGSVLGDCANITRDLVNEPSIDLYPETYANKVQALGKQHGFDVQVFDEKQCEEMGMHAFLAVGKASTRSPRLIVMRWIGGNNMEPIGLIGKGVTYDTGGLSLKPTGSMLHMKSDMTGSAVVVGTMCALARLKSEKNVVGVIAACENSVAGNAFMPGDILQSMNGKTIEIRNTDAEGRLTLADAVTYAIREEHANTIIDIATLTGAVKIALGDQVAAAVTTDQSLYEQLNKASGKVDEQFWQLPINQDYRDLNNSEIADISNLGRDRLAGTISAACFIEAFTEKLPWLHLDIAGVAFNNSTHDYIPKGASGRVVRSMYHFVESFQA